MKIILTLVGIVALLLGLLWAGQGMGYVTWHPAGMQPSFMVGDMGWTYKGIALAVVGLVIIWWSRRR